MLCRDHIIDEYCISKNLHKYNIDYSAFLNSDEQKYVYHLENCNKSKEEVLKEAKEVLDLWNC